MSAYLLKFNDSCLCQNSCMTVLF